MERIKNMRRVLLGLGCMLLAVLFWYFGGERPNRLSNTEHGTAVQTNKAEAKENELSQIFPAAIARFRQNQDSGERTRLLSDLAVRLRAGNSSQAVASLHEFLNSGEDAPTGLGFKLAADGSLAEAPTLRVFALDQWSALDAASAAEYAKRVLETKTSADEWAACLRAVALGKTDQGTQSFLRTKGREMIQFADWREKPSAGFLEAFDVFVFTRDTDSVPELGRLISGQHSPALSHAAFLALDRLVQAEPAPALKTLLDQPAILTGREEMRAGHFARADVRDAAQQQVLRGYLLTPGRSTAELDAFASLYPNGNFMVSNNLLSKSTVLSNEELRQRDHAALRIIEQWLGEREFAALQPQLKQIHARLTEFVRPKVD